MLHELEWGGQMIKFGQLKMDVVKHCVENEHVDMLRYDFEKQYKPVTAHVVAENGILPSSKIGRMLKNNPKLWRHSDEYDAFCNDEDEETESLRDTVKRLSDMVYQMWYAPGMPGAEEAKQSFEKHFQEL